jgi:hypothetical protein
MNKQIKVNPGKVIAVLKKDSNKDMKIKSACNVG